MSFHFRLPASFEPREFLRKPNLQPHLDDARYFVSLIDTNHARRDVDEGVVRLMAKHLRNVMEFRHYSAVIDALLEGGVVTRSPYSVGERAFGYMLGDRYRLDKHVRVLATCPRLIGRLEAYHEQAEQDRQCRLLPVHIGLEHQQKRLRIDGDLAREIIAGLPPESNPFDAQGILVADIEHRDFHLNVGRHGRVSNNITSLKREVRKALRFHGEPLPHVDVCCCQPALIAKNLGDSLCRNKSGTATGGQSGTGGSPNRREIEDTSIYDVQRFPPVGGDFKHFRDLVQRGEFYDFLLLNLQIGSCPNLTREDVKKRFLADVVAKKKANRYGAEYPSAVEDAFKAEFPSVWQFIRQVNHDGWQHENLIRLLQQEESHLVIESVAADLLERLPKLFVLTLHDAIYTSRRGIPHVCRAFEAAFENNGFRMKLKVA